MPGTTAPPSFGKRLGQGLERAGIVVVNALIPTHPLKPGNPFVYRSQSAGDVLSGSIKNGWAGQAAQGNFSPVAGVGAGLLGAAVAGPLGALLGSYLGKHMFKHQPSAPSAYGPYSSGYKLPSGGDAPPTIQYDPSGNGFVPDYQGMASRMRPVGTGGYRNTGGAAGSIGSNFATGGSAGRDAFAFNAENGRTATPWWGTPDGQGNRQDVRGIMV